MSFSKLDLVHRNLLIFRIRHRYFNPENIVENWVIEFIFKLKIVQYMVVQKLLLCRFEVSFFGHFSRFSKTKYFFWLDELIHARLFALIWLVFWSWQRPNAKMSSKRLKLSHAIQSKNHSNPKLDVFLLFSKFDRTSRASEMKRLLDGGMVILGVYVKISLIRPIAKVPTIEKKITIFLMALERKKLQFLAFLWK